MLTSRVHRRARMLRKFFIIGLPVTYTERELSQMVGARYGHVDTASIMRHKVSDSQQVGLGIVTMATPEEAESAVNGMNGTVMDGHCLFVFRADSQMAKVIKTTAMSAG